ncbi:hypothetical protein HPB50_028307 [Hyalomma asiaticum]|nr:hypothetical protein HPB50_028307 [Hyalomma asiaticum]
MTWSKIEPPLLFLANKVDCLTVRRAVEGKHRLADMSPTAQHDAIGLLVLRTRCPHLSQPLQALIQEQVRCGCLSQRITPVQNRKQCEPPRSGHTVGKTHWMTWSKIEPPLLFLANKVDCLTVRRAVEGKHRLADMSPTGQHDAIGLLVLRTRCPHLSQPLQALIQEQVRCGCLSQRITPVQDREHRVVNAAYESGTKPSRGHHGNCSVQPRNFLGTSPWPLPASSLRSRNMASGKERLRLVTTSPQDIKANTKFSSMSHAHVRGVLEQLLSPADTLCLLHLSLRLHEQRDASVVLKKPLRKRIAALRTRSTAEDISAMFGASRRTSSALHRGRCQPVHFALVKSSLEKDAFYWPMNNAESARLQKDPLPQARKSQTMVAMFLSSVGTSPGLPHCHDRQVHIEAMNSSPETSAFVWSVKHDCI